MNFPADTSSSSWANPDSLILEPDGEAILCGARENLKFFQSPGSAICGEALDELRGCCRQEVLTLLGNSSRTKEESSMPLDPQRPWILTGHQAQLFHGGILAKYILADCLAGRLSGEAINLVVDQDIPDCQLVQLPLETQDSLTIESIPLDLLNPDLPTEYQDAPDPKSWVSWREKNCQLPGSVPEILPVQSLFERMTAFASKCHTLSDFFLRMNHHFAESLSIRWIDLPVSILSQTPTFYFFAADWIRNARRVHTLYNQALGDYRLQRNIRNEKQPLPDLGKRGNCLELPFWIFRDKQLRLPLMVQSTEDSILLFAGDLRLLRLSFSSQANWERDGRILREALEADRLQIRPRATALTLFARLFLADYFIHGLGGKRYEPINETFFREYYGIVPPGWATTSANLYFPFRSHYPLPEEIQNIIDSLQHKLRDSTSHPESYLQELEQPVEAEKLIEEKKQVIEIGGRLRFEKAPSSKRRENFQKLRRINEQIATIFSGYRDSLDRQIQMERMRISSARAAYSRKFFFGLFPVQDLLNLKNLVDNRIPAE